MTAPEVPATSTKQVISDVLAKTCTKPRLSFWWDRHGIVRHWAGVLWLALPERHRWTIVHWHYKRHPEVCWCELVDAAYLDVKKEDYRKPWGCGCDVPLPTEAGLPRYGWCYCMPPANRMLLEADQ